MTPVFMGGEPVVATTGKYAGNAVLQTEQDQGLASDTDVFYYRIHSPVILIEFDHQRPVGTRTINPPDLATRAHIHVVVRTPNGNDYGKDLLRQHLATHPH